MSDKLKAVISYLIDVKKVQDMTPKKLQKILYYCYAWYLTLTAENSSEEEIDNAKLFPESFEAWVHGPVIPKVYNKYKNNKNRVIENSNLNVDLSVLTEDEKSTINEVIEVYGMLNGNQLEIISHSEDPWIEARGDKRSLDYCTTNLSDKTIYSYYAARLD